MFGLSPLPRNFAAALRDAGHKKATVRLSALADLARYATGPHRDEVIGVFEHALVHDEAPAIRAEAAILLADAKATQSVASLISAAADVNQRVRQMAIVALGEVGGDCPPDVVETVRQALIDESPEIRFQALIAWGRLAEENALDAFMRACNDDDEHVRHIALRLVEEHCAGGDDETLPREIASLCRRALSDDVPAVRLVAAIILARGGDDADAREVIVSAISRSDRDADLEDLQSAIEIAGRRHFDEARLGLTRRAFAPFGFASDPFAWHCRVALARLGDARGKASILKGLRAWTRDARTLAVAAAGQAGLTEARVHIESMAKDELSADPAAVAEALRLLESSQM